MSPSRIFILRPVATYLLMAAILLAGIVAYKQLPVSALPQVDYPTIQVFTQYPGASPDVMASTVTAPLERQFGEMQSLSQMTSTSSGGISVIVLQFSLALNIDVAEEEVQSAINAAQSFLPSDLPVPPVYSKTNPADAPILTLAVTSDSMPLSPVEDLVDTRLAPKISQLNGVGLVSISGGQKPAIRIQVNPVALSSYGINLEDVRTALTQASVNSAKGNFDGPRQDYQLDANDQITVAGDYANVPIAWRNGAPVLIKDVANVVSGVENTRQAAWMNRTPAVVLNIQRQPGANTINVVKSIKALLPQLEANLPASIKITTLTDLTTSIQASIDDVEFELMLTIGLVVLVIFLFLRSLYATIIPSVAVPVSLVGTIAAMYALGYSLDNFSLMALTISTGFVVDDAIVMVENISRYIELGDPPLQAALKGAGQIGFTILSLTVSLIAVLIPLLFMGDVVGRLFREFAVTLAVTIVISAVVSLTLTPMMSSRILRHRPEDQQTWFYRTSENAFNRMIAFYGRTLKVVLRYQTITLLVALGTLALTIYLYIVIPKGFFPEQDTGVIQGISQAPPSISFPAMVQKQQDLARLILQDPAVESLSSFIGADGASLQGDFQGTAASFKNSLSNEALLILAALVTVYIVLGVLYESFIHPVTILSTLPSAGVGALLALMLFHQELSVVAIIGIILLIGIVKKNGIMIVDFALEAEREQGKDSTEAIYEASLLRFRPIMMTTMAALLGGLPLALGRGLGSELRRPLGIAMVGGLLLSQLLTLYTTPVIYIFFHKLAHRFTRKKRAKPTENGGLMRALEQG